MTKLFSVLSAYKKPIAFPKNILHATDECFINFFVEQKQLLNSNGLLFVVRRK